jgi:hypothetical protein
MTYVHNWVFLTVVLNYILGHILRQILGKCRKHACSILRVAKEIEVKDIDATTNRYIFKYR